MASFCSCAKNLTASMVSGELSTTFSFSSCTLPPQDQMAARVAMRLSSSGLRPRPSGTPRLSLMYTPPSYSSCQVEGPSGKPACSHRLAW